MRLVDAGELKRFEQTLQQARTDSFSGTAFRAVQDRYRQTPLSAVGSIRVGGRYNPKGRFEALYLAETAQSALSEVEFGVTSGGQFVNVPKSPYMILSVNFRLQRVVRLEDHLGELELSAHELTEPWRPLQHLALLGLTQALGAAARGAALEGLVVPSRFTPEIRNLVVFPDNLLRGSLVEVVDPVAGLLARLEKQP